MGVTVNVETLIEEEAPAAVSEAVEEVFPVEGVVHPSVAEDADIKVVEVKLAPAEPTQTESIQVEQTQVENTKECESIGEVTEVEQATHVKEVSAIESNACVEEASILGGNSKEMVGELKTHEESSIECWSADSDMGSMESLEHLTEPESTKLKQSLDESFSDTEIVIPTVEDKVKKEKPQDVIIAATES